jgi:Sulfate permease and related transporters (MFS superfamily)
MLLMNEAKPKVVVIDLSAEFDLEYTALKALGDSEKKQRDRGLTIWLVGLNPRVLQMVQRSPLGKSLGRDKMQFSLELAVAKYLELSAYAIGFDDPSTRV